MPSPTGSRSDSIRPLAERAAERGDAVPGASAHGVLRRGPAPSRHPVPHPRHRGTAVDSRGGGPGRHAAGRPRPRRRVVAAAPSRGRPVPHRSARPGRARPRGDAGCRAGTGSRRTWETRCVGHCANPSPSTMPPPSSTPSTSSRRHRPSTASSRASAISACTGCAAPVRAWPSCAPASVSPCPTSCGSSNRSCGSTSR